MVETTAVQSLQVSATAKARRAEEKMKAFRFILEVIKVYHIVISHKDGISSLKNHCNTKIKKRMDGYLHCGGLKECIERKGICSRCLITRSTYEPGICKRLR